MKNTEINTTANACDKKYFTMLNNALSVMHTITGSLPFCSYDNAHSLTTEDVQKHVFVFNIAKGTAKSIAFALGDNVDLVDSNVYIPSCNACAWNVIINKVSEDIEKIRKAWKIIEDDAQENVDKDSYNDLSVRMNLANHRHADFTTLISTIASEICSAPEADEFIKLMVFHAMNNGKDRRSILEQLDKHNQLEKLYSLEYADKEAQASSIVKEAVNNIFHDVMVSAHEENGVHKFRVKIDTEAKEAVTKACLHAFYEAGASSKKGYHAEVLVENTNKEAICAQVVYAIRRAIQRRIIIENATSEVANG